MTHYLIWFPSAAMVLTEDEFPEVVADSHAVIQEMKDAGVYVFGGGIDEAVEPVVVGRDGSVAAGGYPGREQELDGGFTVIKVETREEAVRWAAKTAAACRCPQQLRAFGYDPAS
ncbi:YciI family protein [Leifsonia sp. RAF41]|uniref:YciI family protein n=1 Tax=Leifsonia sp. RAF41 TaxID=3233056 RepID=UPI003F9C6B69